MSNKLRVLIADDHFIVREGLKQIIKTIPDLILAGEADNGEKVLEIVERENIDLVLLDIHMPGKSGLDVLKELRQKRPKLPVLVISVYEEDLYAIRALKAGASGYLTKASAPDELALAIDKAKSGGRYVSQELAEKLALNLGFDDGKLAHEKLSKREIEVFTLIANGRSLTEIATELNLSIATISTHRAHVLEKMNLGNNVEIARYAVKYGLID